MCVLCYELADEAHWSDFQPLVGEAAAPAARHRYRRASVLNDVLAPAGLVVRTPGPGRAVLVSNRKGASTVAAGLPAVWEAADRMGTRVIDPLDPTYLDALEGRTAVSDGPA